MEYLKQKVEKKVVQTTIDRFVEHIRRNPQKGLLELLEFAKTGNEQSFSQKKYEILKEKVQNPKDPWRNYLVRLAREMEPSVLKTILYQWGYQVGYIGRKTIEKNQKQYQCRIPSVLFLDLTGGKKGNEAEMQGKKQGGLEYETIDQIVEQGKALGIFAYILTGTDPFLRKNTMVKLCRKHADTAFLALTNGLSVSQKFCDAMKQAKNVSVAICMEHGEMQSESNKKIQEAMEILKKSGLLFGVLVRYTGKSIQAVTEETFLDQLIQNGCRFAFYVPDEMEPLQESQEKEWENKRRIMQKTKEIILLDLKKDKEKWIADISTEPYYGYVQATGLMTKDKTTTGGVTIYEKSLLECLKAL